MTAKKLTAEELAVKMEIGNHDWADDAADMLRQQQAEIEDLKNANRFIQNFAEEQHKRAVALEMRELTDEEIMEIYNDQANRDFQLRSDPFKFARAILQKASEK